MVYFWGISIAYPRDSVPAMDFFGEVISIFQFSEFTICFLFRAKDTRKHIFSGWSTEKKWVLSNGGMIQSTIFIIIPFPHSLRLAQEKT
jgi:hypothetical protein